MKLRTPEILLAAAFGVNLFGDRDKVSEFILVASPYKLILQREGKLEKYSSSLIPEEEVQLMLNGEWSRLNIRSVDILTKYVPAEVELALRYAAVLTVNSFEYYMKMLPKPVPPDLRTEFAQILYKSQMELREQVANGKGDKSKIIEIITKPHKKWK